MHAQEAAAVLQAISQSLQPLDSDSSESSGVDTDTEAEEEDAVFGTEPFDEQYFIDRMTREQRVEFNAATAADQQAGWQQRCTDTGRHQFSPGNRPVGCLLPDTVITPLDYFLQLVTPDTIDYFCERTNVYARHPQKKRKQHCTVYIVADRS